MSKTTPKDVFLELGAIFTLYLSAGSLLTLFFQYINYWVPDPLAGFYGGRSIRWAIASLVIAYPIHLLIMRALGQEFAKEPTKLEGRLRKWLLYFTLFAAAVILGGDLVALVYNFLDGELSVRFYLKVLAVALIFSGVFFYGRADLRRATGNLSKKQKQLAWGVSLLALLFVGTGFFIAGSPFYQRLVRFDSERISHLQSIQWQVVNYWQTTGKLPEKIDDLKDELTGFTPPPDPKTATTYEYRVIAPLAFELCATFDTADQSGGLKSAPASPYYPIREPYGASENWQHGQGRVCFSRTIDPVRNLKMFQQ